MYTSKCSKVVADVFVPTAPLYFKDFKDFIKMHANDENAF